LILFTDKIKAMLLRLAFQKKLLTLRLLLLLLLLSPTLYAQEKVDTNLVSGKIITPDTAETQDSVKKHSPKKATLLSVALPGTGQLYNRKYWKAPIVYAALGTSIYFFTYNRIEYNKFRSAYIDRLDSTKTAPAWANGIPTDRLRAESEQFRNRSEFAFIGVFLVYILQIVDATVDAHLFTFDVSDDLSLRLLPTQTYTAYQYKTGVNLSLNWRF
jgi:hypothetical protein